jgi:UDP-glucose 4-epimerase
MKIIVTGGAGFIASHIADAYLKAGHNVVVVDNLLTGFRKNLNPKAKFYKADIRNQSAIDLIFKKERPEIVNHHAAIAEVVKSIHDPIPTLDVNVLGTTNILLAFGNHGRGKHKKIIFSSTGGAMYGDPKKIPADELEARIPLSPYSLSKQLDEDVIKFYSRQFGFNYLIFRYANVYGPRQNPKGEAGVVAIFGGLMKAGLRPTIFGDGTKARDYVYVDDVARANLTALRKGNREVINLGSGKLITDKMIFDAVAKTTGFTKKPIYAPYRKGEVYRIAITGAKAKKILGWEPRMTFQKGVENTISSLSGRSLS